MAGLITVGLACRGGGPLGLAARQANTAAHLTLQRCDVDSVEADAIRVNPRITGDEQAVTVRAGETTEVRVPFAAVGYLRVTTEGSGTRSPTISINGEAANEWGLWMAVPAGSYTVSFEDLSTVAPGTVRPCDRTVTITAGATTRVHGHYGTGTCNVVP